MFGSWLNKTLNGIPKIYRWQGKTLIANPRRNDAEHMWSVAIIAEGLARIEEEKFGNKVDMALLLQKAIFHDCIEVETGDIPSGVKRRTKTMIKGIEDVEKDYFEHGLKPLIPHKWRPDYENFLLNPKDDKKTLEGKILAVADNIDALNECIQEVRFGNPIFKTYLAEITNAILDLDVNCGNYFIKYCLIDFDLPNYEYGERVRNFIKTYEFKEMNDGDK